MIHRIALKSGSRTSSPPAGHATVYRDTGLIFANNRVYGSPIHWHRAPHHVAAINQGQLRHLDWAGVGHASVCASAITFSFVRGAYVEVMQYSGMWTVRRRIAQVQRAWRARRESLRRLNLALALHGGGLADLLSDVFVGMVLPLI